MDYKMQNTYELTDLMAIKVNLQQYLNTCNLSSTTQQVLKLLIEQTDRIIKEIRTIEGR